MKNIIESSPWADTKHEFWAYISRAADRYVEFLTERKDISARVLPDTRSDQEIEKEPRVPAFHHPASRTIFVDASVSLKTVPQIDANMNLIRVEDRIKYPILSGLLFHEMSHAMHTLYGFNQKDADGKPITSLENYFITNMEEFRCEYGFSQKHKAEAEFVFSAVTHINFPSAIKSIREIRKNPDATDYSKISMALSLYFLIIARIKSGTVKEHLIPGEILDYIQEIIEPKNQEFLSEKVDATFSLADTDFFGLLAIAREIIENFGLNDSPNQDIPEDLSACNHPVFMPNEDDSAEDGESGEDSGGEVSSESSEDEESGETENGETGSGKSSEDDEESDETPDDTQFQKDSQGGFSEESSEEETDENSDQGSSSNNVNDKKDDDNSGEGEEVGDIANGENEWPSREDSEGTTPDIERLIRDLELEIEKERKDIIDVDASKEINARVQLAEQKMTKGIQNRLDAKSLGNTISAQGVAKNSAVSSFFFEERTFKAKMGNRKPTTIEKEQAKVLEDYIRKAQFRSDSKHLIDSEIPPGRFRTSQAMKLNVQRSLKMNETATPWRRVKREIHENPELNVAMAIDFSGSMDEFLSGVSGYGWMLSQAVKRNRGKVSSVFWDNDVYRGILPTEFNDTLVQPLAANGGSMGLALAIEGASGLANLLGNDTGVNMMVVFTDSDLRNYPAINRELKKLVEMGVRVLWLSTTPLWSQEKNQVMSHPNITKTFVPSSDKFSEVVTKAIDESLYAYHSAW